MTNKLEQEAADWIENYRLCNDMQPSADKGYLAGAKAERERLTAPLPEDVQKVVGLIKSYIFHLHSCHSLDTARPNRSCDCGVDAALTLLETTLRRVGKLEAENERLKLELEMGPI